MLLCTAVFRRHPNNLHSEETLIELLGFDSSDAACVGRRVKLMMLNERL